MKKLTILILLTLPLEGIACNISMSDFITGELPKMTTWNALYSSYKAHIPGCNDAAYGQGYSDVVAKLLVRSLPELTVLEKINEIDPHFTKFVINHIDGTASYKDIEFIAKKQCARYQSTLCGSVTKVAINVYGTM